MSRPPQTAERKAAYRASAEQLAAAIPSSAAQLSRSVAMPGAPSAPLDSLPRGPDERAAEPAERVERAVRACSGGRGRWRAHAP